MKKNQLLLETLMELCYCYFKEYEFSEGTIKRYKSKLRELIIFMNERDLSSYNESIGEAFIQYVISEKTLANYTLKTFKRTIYVLNGVLNGEPYSPKKRSRTYPMPGSIGELANKFFEKFLIEIRPAEGTIYQDKVGLSYFSVIIIPIK